MGSSREKIILFTRYPEAGKVKTRLIPVLGREETAKLHRDMVEHTLDRLKKFKSFRSVEVEVCFEGGEQDLWESWLGKGIEYFPQKNGGLGERMEEAFRRAFSQGRERAILIGTDIPGIASGLLEEALEGLKVYDVVIGPALDGGYYLIGLSKICPEIFKDIPWSTDEVFARTLEIVKDASLSVLPLQPLADVDRPEDLCQWKARADRREITLSIIIPTLNEEENILPAISSVQRSGMAGIEILVVDGGSSDQTVPFAKFLGVPVLCSPPGRAGQMNLGARCARGNILLFLHGDTRLPEGFGEKVQDLLSQPGVTAGAFRISLDGKKRGLRVIEWLANFRSERLRMPYGDQAIFVKKEVFEEVGGFPDLPIMEDFAFMKMLRAKGRIEIVSLPVITSARRWETKGLLWTTLLNQLMILGYHLGISPHRLARWYYRKQEDNLLKSDG